MPNYVRDLREQYADVPWQRGFLIRTRSVQRMDPEWQREADYRERCSLFANFSLIDEGRSRVCLYVFDTPEECMAALRQHNIDLAKRRTENPK